MSTTPPTWMTPASSFSCPQCAKAFTRAVNLDRHLVTHSAVLPYSCRLCSRSFARSDVLQKHHLRCTRSRERSLTARATTSPRRDGDLEQHAAPDQDGEGDFSSAERPPLPAQTSTHPSRPRVSVACARCSQAKSKCDGTSPACARCSRHGFLCRYPDDLRARRLGSASQRVQTSANPMEPVTRARNGAWSASAPSQLLEHRQAPPLRQQPAQADPVLHPPFPFPNDPIPSSLNIEALSNDFMASQEHVLDWLLADDLGAFEFPYLCDPGDASFLLSTPRQPTGTRTTTAVNDHATGDAARNTVPPAATWPEESPRSAVSPPSTSTGPASSIAPGRMRSATPSEEGSSRSDRADDGSDPGASDDDGALRNASPAKAGSPSTQSTSRKRKRARVWPNRWNPTSDDVGGPAPGDVDSHLSLANICRANEEQLMMENSGLVPALDEATKERIVQELRFCNVKAEELAKIQATIRAIDCKTLNLFLQLYFENGESSVPLFHRSSFVTSRCDPLLLGALCSYGAVFSKVTGSLAFATYCSSILHATVYRLFGLDISRSRYIPTLQTLHIIYAMWRHLGDPAKLEFCEVFKGVTTTIARRCRLFDLAEAPSPGRLSELDGERLDAAWRGWAQKEEQRRIGWALVHADADLSICWDLPCVFSVAELNSTLPCTDSVWSATSATEWLAALHRDSTSPTLLSDFLLSLRSAEKGPTLLYQPDFALSILASALHNVACSARGSAAILVDKEGLRVLLEKASALLPDRPALQIVMRAIQLGTLLDFRRLQLISGRRGFTVGDAEAERLTESLEPDPDKVKDIIEHASRIFSLSTQSSAHPVLLFYATVCLSTLSRSSLIPQSCFLSRVGNLSHQLAPRRLITVAIDECLDRCPWPVAATLARILRSWRDHYG